MVSEVLAFVGVHKHMLVLMSVHKHTHMHTAHKHSQIRSLVHASRSMGVDARKTTTQSYARRWTTCPHTHTHTYIHTYIYIHTYTHARSALCAFEFKCFVCSAFQVCACCCCRFVHVFVVSVPRVRRESDYTVQSHGYNAQSYALRSTTSQTFLEDGLTSVCRIQLHPLSPLKGG